MDNLLKNQSVLQEQANDVVLNLDLKNLLSKFGEFKLVGSIVFGLMTWRDIDIDLVLLSDPGDEIYWEIVKTLFEKAGVKNLNLADNRKQDETDRPRSMYIGVKYEDILKNIWKIDIRLLGKEFVTTDAVEELIKTATEEHRKTILTIKSKVHDNPKYHKTFSSLDIYEAVIKQNVSDLNGFHIYLDKINKEY